MRRSNRNLVVFTTNFRFEYIIISIDKKAPIYRKLLQLIPHWGKSIINTTKGGLCFVVPTIFEYSAASLIVRLESFISRDLCNIWDCKLEYEDQRDQITDDNEGMYCHERYEVVYTG